MDLNLSRLSLNQIKTFIVAARTENLSVTARELGATQPYVSSQIGALEKEVNLALFVRHSRGIYLTKQGQEFFGLCQDIVGRLSQGIDSIREKDFDSERKFHFLSGNGLLETIMGKSELFSKKFSRFSFNFSTIINVYQIVLNLYQLQIGKVDATVMPEAISDPEFIQLPLYKNPLRIYASPHYLRSHSTPKTIQDLQTHKIIFFTRENQGVMNQQIMNEQTRNFLEPSMEVATVPAMRTALIHSAGIGCYGYNQEIVKKGLLVDVFPNMPDQITSYYYTYHKRLEGSPKIEAFYEFLKDITKVWERP